MKRAPLLLALSVSVLGLSSLFVSVKPRLVWNRTDSAPKGLYGVKAAPVSEGDWVVLSPESEPVLWIAKHGFVGRGWPVIKQVEAVEGDEICRDKLIIRVNGAVVAAAKNQTSAGVNLPSWQGCRTLEDNEVFLLGNHENSLDGRYFGPVHRRDIDGVAVLVWKTERQSDGRPVKEAASE